VPDIAQSQQSVSVIGRDAADARKLAYFPAIGLEFRASSRQFAFQHKPLELAMHIAARADAFHDLLPDVATFGEVEGVLLIGFLRKIAISNIRSVFGKSNHDTELFQRLAADGYGPGLDQQIPYLHNCCRRSPEFINRKLRTGYACKRQRDAAVQAR